MIGQSNSRHVFHQSDATLKPTVTCLLHFPAHFTVHVFTLNSYGFPVMLSLALIGCCDYVTFGFHLRPYYNSKLKFIFNKRLKLCLP